MKQKAFVYEAKSFCLFIVSWIDIKWRTFCSFALVIFRFLNHRQEICVHLRTGTRKGGEYKCVARKPVEHEFSCF